MPNTQLDALVLQHLYARGFTRAAEMLQQDLGTEASATAADESRPTLHKLLASSAAPAYAQSYSTLRDWIAGSLDAYQPELQQVLFPLFVQCYLALVQSSERGLAAAFADEYGVDHELRHRDELNLLRQVSTPAQVAGHAYAKRMLSQRYEVTLSGYARALLLRFLQQARLVVLLTLLNNHLTLDVARLAPTAHPDGVVAAAAQAWLNLSEEEARQHNSGAIACGTLRVLHEKHKDIVRATHPELLAPPDEDEEGKDGEKDGDGGKDGKGKKKKKRKKTALSTAAIKEGEIEARLVDPPPVPLPPLNDRAEKEVVKDDLKRQQLDETALPSALMVTVVDSHEQLCAATVAHDASSVACGFADGAVRLYLLKDKDGQAAAKKKRKQQEAAAAAAAAAAAPSSAASADADGDVDMTAANGNGVGGEGNGAEAPGGGTVAVAAFVEPGAPVPASADASAEAGAGDVGGADDDGGGPTTVVLRGHSGPVYGVSFTRDDKQLVSCSQDGTARLWGMLTRSCLVCYRAHATPVWSVRFAPLGSYFATCGYDRTCRVFTVAQVQPLRVLVGHHADVRCCAFHPNAALLATGSDDLSVRVWDISSAKCARLLCRGGHSAAVTALAFANDGTTLASGGEDHVAILWSLANGKMLRKLRAHTEPVWALSFSVEGNQLVSASADCSVAIWDAAAATSGAPLDEQADDADGGGRGGAGRRGDEDNGGGDGGARRRRVAPPPSPFLLKQLHTKSTPVVAAHYTRTNVLMAVGAYKVPPELRDD